MFVIRLPTMILYSHQKNNSRRVRERLFVEEISITCHAKRVEMNINIIKVNKMSAIIIKAWMDFMSTKEEAFEKNIKNVYFRPPGCEFS